MKTLLHVGCGRLRMRDLPYFRDGGWDEITYDIDPSVQPDIVGETKDMSLVGDGSIDALWSSHNIEHVWSFEVQPVLREFRRVLREDGFLVVLCPDMLQLAQAVIEGKLETMLYNSPAGPIRTIDILYGHQPSIEAGNHYMAHRMAFTSETLAARLLGAGFASVVVLRDRACGLHAVATASAAPLAWLEDMAHKTNQQPELVFDGMSYGTFAGEAQSR
jgi:SAM-dependent methyltransferase